MTCLQEVPWRKTPKKDTEPQQSDSCTNVFCSDPYIFNKSQIQAIASFSSSWAFTDSPKWVIVHWNSQNYGAGFSKWCTWQELQDTTNGPYGGRWNSLPSLLLLGVLWFCPFSHLLRFSRSLALVKSTNGSGGLNIPQGPPSIIWKAQTLLISPNISHDQRTKRVRFTDLSVWFGEQPICCWLVASKTALLALRKMFLCSHPPVGIGQTLLPFFPMQHTAASSHSLPIHQFRLGTQFFHMHSKLFWLDLILSKQ